MLYQTVRPTNLEAVLGQDTVCETLLSWYESQTIPHALLLTGPSGTGKTTIARIIADDLLGIDPAGITELNTADMRGIDTIRAIRESANQYSLGGEGYKVWIIDECHQLTKVAQDAILKLLEDPPAHVYFILCTTNPEKLSQTIKTRCNLLSLGSIPDEDIERLVANTYRGEFDIDIADQVLYAIVGAAEGSARLALTILEKVIAHDDESKQLEVIEAVTCEGSGIALARALFGKTPTWKTIAKILAEIKKQGLEPEGIRRIVLGYGTSILHKSVNKKAYNLILCFERNYFDSGHAGLVASCFQFLNE